MATSGSISVSFTSWDTLKFSWSLASQSIENNTSTVSWTLQLIAGSSGRISSSAKKDYQIVVNGTTYSGTNYIGIGNNETKTLKSGSTVIQHEDDGSKTFRFSFNQEIDITFSGSHIGWKSGSGSGVLETIPRKSSLSVSNGTLGTALALTVDRKATSFTHTITCKCGSASGTVCTKSSDTSLSFTPPLSFASQNTTGTSVTVTFTIETFSGSTSIGTNAKTITCSIPASVKPSCTLEVTDAMGYANTYGGYIKGLSQFKVVISPSTSYGSAIASYKTTANGATYTAASFTTGELKNAGTLTVNATVTDKRGRSGSTSKSLNVLDYAEPAVSKLTVKRCNEDGAENDQGAFLQVKFSAKVTSLNGKNTATYTLKHKAASASSATTVNLTAIKNNYAVTDYTYVFAADTGSSYHIELTAADAFGRDVKTTDASTAFTLMHWSTGGTGMGIGKVAEAENLLDIGIPVRFREGAVNNLLWSGGWYMTAGHIAELSEPVSKQVSGIVLVFSEYADGAAADQSFHSKFMPKTEIAMHPGRGHCFQMTSSGLGYFATKYLHIYDDRIVGHENNNQTGTGVCGITYTNNRFVLRYVIGV